MSSTVALQAERTYAAIGWGGHTTHSSSYSTGVSVLLRKRRTVKPVAMAIAKAITKAIKMTIAMTTTIPITMTITMVIIMPIRIAITMAIAKTIKMAKTIAITMAMATTIAMALTITMAMAIKKNNNDNINHIQVGDPQYPVRCTTAIPALSSGRRWVGVRKYIWQG